MEAYNQKPFDSEIIELALAFKFVSKDQRDPQNNEHVLDRKKLGTLIAVLGKLKRSSEIKAISKTIDPSERDTIYLKDF